MLCLSDYLNPDSLITKDILNAELSLDSFLQNIDKSTTY